MPIQDHLEELEGLARLSRTLSTASADVGSPGAHAMARALAIRLSTSGPRSGSSRTRRPRRTPKPPVVREIPASGLGPYDGDSIVNLAIVIAAIGSAACALSGRPAEATMLLVFLLVAVGVRLRPPRPGISRSGWRRSRHC